LTVDQFVEPARFLSSGIVVRKTSAAPERLNIFPRPALFLNFLRLAAFQHDIRHAEA